jgi:hypothetical protein
MWSQNLITIYLLSLIPKCRLTPLCSSSMRLWLLIFRFTSILLHVFATYYNFVALQVHIDLLRTTAWHVHFVAEIPIVVNLQLGRVVAQLLAICEFFNGQSEYTIKLLHAIKILSFFLFRSYHLFFFGIRLILSQKIIPRFWLSQILCYPCR